MRQYYLKNANGAVYDLTKVKESFLHSVSGLGYERENTYQRVGNHFATLKSRLKQGAFNGIVQFWRADGQRDYQAFVKFCQFEPITLVYNPNGNKEYFSRGSISKVVYDEAKPLQAAITFTCTTPFFESVRVVTYPGDSGEYGKIYDYTYPYRYSSATTNNVTINMDSTEESPCKLTLYGTLVNPEWRHYVNNQLVATGRVNVTIPANHHLVIDTTGDEFTIREYDNLNQFVADRYQLSDFGTTRAVYLRYGQNRITVDDDGGNKVTVVAEGELFYASV